MMEWGVLDVVVRTEEKRESALLVV